MQYRRWKIVALPILTLLGTMVCAALIVWGLSRVGPAQSIFQNTIMETAPAMFALPFVTNVMITVLIVVRIHQVRVNLVGITSYGFCPQTADTIYKRMVWGAIESCVVYPVFLLLAIVLYFLKTNVLLLVTGSMTQVVAIVPTLMWLQIVLGLSWCDGAVRGATTSAPTLRGSIGFRTGTPQSENEGGVEEMIAMSRLEEGRNSESQSARIETVSRTEAVRCM